MTKVVADIMEEQALINTQVEIHIKIAIILVSVAILKLLKKIILKN